MICNIKIKRHFLLLIATVLLFVKANAQYNSQEELKKAAQTFFDEENYIESLPLYSQLLSLYPKDPDYNYKYGASYFYGNREKENSLKYLRFAVSKPNVNPQAFYFLATALHHEYLFTEAELNYNRFKEKGVALDFQKFQVDRKIEMCKNGITLIKGMTDIGVLVKKEIKATDFFRSYDLRGIGGKIIVKPDEFKTKLDIKKNETSIIHLGSEPTMVVFSSYGNNEKNGKDIYKVVKLPNGSWSEPSPFTKINTKFDEDYPFLHPDGRTMYFSSKGYNSMGGYDIFKSTLDPTSGEWSFPENLDFPINTPDDDILFISDIDNELAYFASSRASKQGELTVYKVQVDRQPSENTIVKGIFLSEANPNMKSATITIMDAEKDKKYGVFSSNKDNGNYVLVFPGNGGKFKIMLETTNDAPVHSALIELPSLDGFRALKQELRLVGQANDEKLVVKNLFNESDEFDMSDPLIVENLLKYKAKMDVNLTEDEAIKNIDNTNAKTSISGLANLSNQEMVDNAQKGSKTIAQNAKLSRIQSNQAYDLATQKSAEAKTIFNQSQQKINIAKESEDLAIKSSAFIEADKLKLQAAKLVNEAVSALNIAKTLESEAVERESDVNKSAELSTAISAKINAGNRNDAETSYAQLEEITNSTYNQESALTTEKTILENKLSDKELAYSKIRNNAIELKNRETELVEKIDMLKEKLSKTSKKPEKEAIQSEVNSLLVDLEDTKYDIGVAADNESKLNKELKEIKNNFTTSNDVIAIVSKTDIQKPSKSIDKTALNSDILFFEKQGLVGLYPSDETLIVSNSLEKFDLKDHKNEYSIISDDGKIIDYSSTHSSKLVDAQQNSNENQKSLEMAKINQNWIADIDQEIAIREKQQKAADNLNDKTKYASRVEVLKNLKIEKQKEADQYLLLAQENNTSVAKTNKQISNNNNSIKETTPVNITDAQGNIVNYSADYEKQLVVIEEKENTPATINEKITVYEQWKNANEQELLLKKIELKSAEGEEKITIVNRIEELDNQIANNKEYIALYNEKLPKEGLIANNEKTTEATLANSKTIDYSKYDSKVVNSVGEVQDYSINYNKQITNADNIVDPLASKKEKENVLTAWVNSVNEEINLKNEQLIGANPTEKESITERINSLSNEKAALNNQLSDVKLASSQQESLMALKNNTIEVEANKSTTNTISNETSNSSNQKAKELVQENLLKEDIVELNKQVEEKTTLAYASKDVTTRERLLTEASNLKSEQEGKQLELAKVYEKSNKAEYYNNQEAISKIKLNATPNNDNEILAELNTDEANTYFDKAQEEREKALNATTFSAKESALNKAQNMELTAIEKQKKAIELYSGKTVNEALASLPNEKTNSSILTTPENSTIQKSTTTSSAVNSTILYQPTKLSMPSDIEVAKAKTAELEATRLEKVAFVLQDSTQKVTKKADKDALIAESNANNDKAKQLRKDAEISYATAKELASQEQTTVIAINENRNELSNEKFSDQDKQVIDKLSGSGITQIKNSPEYQEYSANKKEARRLIKDAEVEYVKADKLQEEAEDQKTLGISLNAMANGAQGDAKTKLLGQIVKLNNMIGVNEAEANVARTAATNKEINALEKTKAAANILASSTTSNQIKAIEKANEYNGNYLSNALANNSTSPVTNYTTAKTTQPEVADKTSKVAENSTSPVTNNATAKTIQPEVAIDNSNIVTENTTTNPIENNLTAKTTQPEVAAENTNTVIENTSTENINEPEVVVENKSNSINSINNSNKTQVATNQTTLAKVDEIPQVLTDQIFMFTPNKSAAYSENKKIPSAVTLPEGLVFKVQIGAFRNPIPQDHFRGFAPISAEDAGNGITRYTAGLFKTFNMANEAKNSIRTIGYPDAFVVAFLNGKRIDVNQARSMVDGTTITQNGNITENTQNTVANNSENSSNKTTDVNKIIPPTKTNVELVEDGISTDVNKIKGVFFTVQVGVYSKVITAAELNNVTPLNSERIANGLIRYTSGTYPTLNEANLAKEKIKTLGIIDAFVVAYANGNRVGVNEAVGFVTNNNEVAVKSTNTNLSNTPTTNVNKTESNSANNNTTANPNNSVNNSLPKESSTVQNNSSPTETSLSTNPEKKPINQVEIGQKLNIVYSVLLGEYEDEVPVEDAQVFLKLSGKGVKVSERNNKTIYTIGSYPDYPSALDLQIEMKVEGIKSPKVIAQKDGAPIEVNEALELVKNYDK